MKNRIQMTFTCDQRWDEMKISGSGRHCELCKCVVHDFAGMSVSEISARSNGKELCGSFSPEQVDPGLMPLQWPRSLKAAMLTAGAVIGLETGHAYGQDAPDKPKTEIINTNRTIQSGDVIPGPNFESPQTSADDCVTSKPYKRRKHYYLSWRFPFVHKSHLRLMGRYRH